MSTGEDEPSSGLNGRLRPRKSNPSPQTKQILRKSDSKNVPDKPKRNNTLPKVSPNKTDDLDNKSENPTPQLLCPYCDKKFVSKQTASKHAHRIHLSSLKQDSIIDCLFCNHAEPESNDIIRHMVDSHPNQYFACLDCHTRFSSTSDLAEHKLNLCEKQKLPYRSKLRQKPDGKKNLKSLNTDTKQSFEIKNKKFPAGGEFDGIVISCELKPTQGHDEADIEDNITTNLILPSGKGISHKAVIEKNAVIVLDDIQWNKRLPSNFSFHNTDADQILSRLGVVHKSPRTGEPKKDCHKNNDTSPQTFEKCFDTNFYSKVASNVHENLTKYLDGSFNPNHEPDSTIKTRKSKNSIAINTAEGFPILLACEQYSRNFFDGFMPRAIAPKHKWKWDTPESDRDIIDADEIKRDAHLDNCIITYVSNLDIWTQLSMRRKFENKCNKPVEKRTEKQNIISKELKEILESREIPTSLSQGPSNVNHKNTTISGDGASFPHMLGLTPTIRSRDLQPAVLSGEWVRPRCYVCCACGAQTRDPRGLSSHISTQHPNAYVQHYEIVGEPLLDADILKHLYVPPSQALNRSRPLRGFRECTKCKKFITLEDLHQHMLDCAGDTPTIRRKCRYRPFGVRKRRPRLPDNRIRRKMRKDMRNGQSNDKNHLRPRPKTKSEVGDAETIRRMLADLPAKRHRVMVNPLNSFPRRKHDRKCNSLMVKKRSLDDRNYINTNDEFSKTEGSDSLSNPKPNDCSFNNEDENEEDDDDLPLKPKLKSNALKSPRQKESLNRNATMNRSKRKSNKEFNLPVESPNEAPADYSGGNQPAELSMNNSPNRVNVNGGTDNVREHSNRGGSNNRDDQQPGSSRQNGNSRDFVPPTQNVPLKHSIARLTADSETHDKSVQFHRLFLVQQECNNLDQRHLPSDRRLLFENEAVVTKLDKPPLHFNPRGTFDIQNQRKNKSNRPRKRLNDCIAMLKNKLTPNNEDDIPGHVSVQCGSDEPIEQEPFMEDQSIYVAEICKDTQNKPSNPPQKLTQEAPLEKPHIEDSNTNQLDKTPVKIISDSEHSSTLQCNINNEIENNQGDKSTTITKKPESPKCESTQLTQAGTPEIEITQTDTIPLPLPRNTVIRKSPKISVNYANSQEELRIPLNSTTIQVSECVNNDSASKNVNKIRTNESTTPIPEGISETNDKRQLLRLAEQNDPEPEKSLKKAEKNPNNSYQINLNTQVNICEKEVRLSNGIEIEQNIVICPKMNVDLPLSDFREIPCHLIPPAHASTTIESIISTPLDLSGKKLRPSISSSEDTFASNYNSYETLDLSNKNVGGDQINTNLIDDIPTDVVVDLSIKSCQSKSANFSRKTTNNIDDDKIDDDLSYETLNDILPTDLSVKKNNTTSLTMLPHICGEVDEFVQDLSSHTKRKEIISDQSANIDYNIKDLPTDFSSNRDDSSMIIEIIDNETDDLSSQDPNKELPMIDNSRNTNQKHVYDNTGVNLIHEMEEPFVNTTNDHINVDIQAESTYTVESIDIEKSVTPVPQHSEFPRSNVAPHVANHTQLKDTVDISNQATTTVPQKFEIVTNQPLTPYMENTVIVPQETIHYEIGSSASPGSTKANKSSLPVYSKNRNVTMQVPVCTFEGITTERTSSNVCVSVAKADTSSSPRAVNSLSNILTAAIPSTGSVYARVDTSVNTNNNFIDLSSETDSFKHQGDTSDVPDHYDLTKEEIIDCDVEQDTDTARKIAMLPKELVKILGTMPMDHRKQLLDVLPQYVSTAAFIESGEFTVSQKNISSMRSPSPVLQQFIPAVHDHAENSNTDLTRSTKNISHETRSHSRSNVCPASSSSGLSVSKDSVPQSVILKAPVASNDSHHSTSKHSHHEYTSIITPDVNRTVSVLNRSSKLITNEDVQSTIIDLTEDENIKEIHHDKQLINNDSSAVKEVSPYNQTIQCLSESPLQKGNSDQTASLRAVRIKAPSERNKRAATDYRNESIYRNNISEGHDYTNRQTLTMDLKNVDQRTKNGIQEGDEHIKTIATNDVYVSPVKEADVSKSFDEQSDISGNILSKSSVILTPASLEKNVRVSLDERYENDKNLSLTDLSAISSQSAGNKDDEFIEVNNTIASNLVSDADNDNLIDTPPSTNQFKENTTNNDEDSEDDISLAVIVQQKQREQALVSSDNNTLYIKGDVISTCKKRKKSKRSKKALLKTLKSDDDIIVNTKSNVDKRLGAESIDMDPPALNTDTVQFNFETEENHAFAERRKRKARHRCDTATSDEGLCRAKKRDEPVSNLNIEVNVALEDDKSGTKCQEAVLSKNILKDDLIHTYRQDKEQRNFVTVNSDVICSSSVEIMENVLESEANDTEKMSSSEKTQQNSEEECRVPEQNMGLENDKSLEKHSYKKYFKDTDEIRNSCNLNLIPPNNSDSILHEPVDQQKSQSNQEIEQHEPSPSNISSTDIKSKKGRGKRNKNKDSADSYKPQSIVTFETEEASVAPLRRSRRGKSMFVDNALVDSGALNQNDVITDKKGPLTKKQLIFSKLLLDEENISKPDISAVIAKNPIVVISNVDLSSHMTSVQQKDNNDTVDLSPINYSKPIKSFKRKKSPQIKRKIKKLKPLNNARDDNNFKSTVLNNNDEESETKSQERTNYVTIVEPSSNVIFSKDINALPTADEDKGSTASADVHNKKNSYSEGFVEKSTIIETNMKSTTIEKRKMSCLLTSADGTISSTSKKSKLDNTLEFAHNEDKNPDANENCIKSRIRNHNIESRNKTCYNSHVAVRRTRSKSVGVKSSTQLYDPYDIELEDMIDKDESYGRRLKSSDNSFNNMSYVRRSEIKKVNKCETSVGVNAVPVSSDTTTEKTSSNTGSKEDVSDSDDSSKSDVPLKKYVEEKEKKNFELNIKKVSTTPALSEDKKTNKSERKIEEDSKKQGNRQQENNRERKSEQFMISDRKPRKSNLIANKKISETFNADETDDGTVEAGEQTIKKKTATVTVPTTRLTTASISTTALAITTVNSTALNKDAIITTASAINITAIKESAPDATAATVSYKDATATTASTSHSTATSAIEATVTKASVTNATATSVFPAETTSSPAIHTTVTKTSVTDSTATTASVIDATVTTAPVTDAPPATGPTTDAPATAASNTDATAATAAAADATATTDLATDAPATALTTTTTGTSSTENDTKHEDNVSRDSSPSPSKKSGKRGRKKATCTKPLPCYCLICKKKFKRPDNYLRHQMTLLHISKLSEVEMKIKTTPVHEEPNFLIAYKQQLDRLKMLTEKVSKRRKTSKPTSKITIPTLNQILATVNKTVRQQQLSRRNLSRDEALFLDCCELLKESHKPEMATTTENVTITTDVTDVSTTSQAPAAEASGTTTKNAETDDNKNDGDVDSITARDILESEEVRNLENDLISGLKEAVANSIAKASSTTELQQTMEQPPSEIILEKTEEDAISNTPVAKSQVEQIDYPENTTEEPSTSKPKKNQESKEKMYPDVVDSIDVFEDKFDKIKRKCRSQAAAAKQVKPVVEPRLRQKGRKKRGRRSTKKVIPAIPTKGALKVFDGIKVSIPTSEINMSAVGCSVENTPKKRKRSNTKKKNGKHETEIKHKSNPDYKAKSTQTKKVDVYEFMDNEDAELFEFRPSTLMERFKNINSKDMPSTSKYVPSNDKTDYSSESCSDEDDFVYDDYVCSDEETENSLMSCELGNGKLGNDAKKCSSSLKRKDVIEKNAVMGKIFKHNAVRPEKKYNKTKDYPKPKANLDQLFDSLLQDEPGPSTSTYKSPKNEEFVSPRKHELHKKHDSTTPKKYECLTPRKHEIISPKKHEFSMPTKHESVSPKKHGYSPTKKYETPTRSHDADAIRKHDSELSRKYENESHRKYHSSSSRKYECLISEKHDSETKDESVTPRKHESVSCRKHDATSKYNSGKVYPVSSAIRKGSDGSSKTQDRPSKHEMFDERPSTSKKYNSSSRELFKTSPKKYYSTTYSPSIHEPSTSKMNCESRRSSKTYEYSSHTHGSSSKTFDYNECIRKHSRDKSSSPDVEEGNDSVSDGGMEREEEGVARQRARRKCTVGKQNVLAESWSSESDPDGGAGGRGGRARGAEGAAAAGRRRRGRRARVGPVQRRDVEARVAAAARLAARPRPRPRSRSRSRSPSTSPAGRPASACSSDADDDQERRQQHGWIVGDSHKKLVTMLAHAKGRRRNHDDKRHNID